MSEAIWKLSNPKPGTILVEASNILSGDLGGITLTIPLPQRDWTLSELQLATIDEAINLLTQMRNKHPSKRKP